MISTAEIVMRRLENANAGGLFCCDADREEAIEIIQEAISAHDAENERLRAAVEIATARLTAIRDGEAFQPRLHAATGVTEISDLLASGPAASCMRAKNDPA